MKSYVDIRDEVVAQIAAVFARRKDIQVMAHPGRFDEEEVKRLAARTPAIITSVMSIDGTASDDNQRLQFNTMVLVRAANDDRLFDAALRILSILIPTLRTLDAPWSIGGATNIDARNIYSASQGGINVCLWSITWGWKLRGTALISGEDIGGAGEGVDEILGGIPEVSEVVDFAGYTGLSHVGTDDVTDVVTYELPP